VYPWLLFLHIGAVILFALAHGVHVVIMWRWREAEDPAFGLTLFNGLPGARLTRIFLLAVVATGLLLAVLADSWGDLWMWLSLAVLAGIWLAMWRWGAGYFGLVQQAAERAVEERGGGTSGAALEAYRAARLGWQPRAMMAVGIGGLGLVLWLMIFKPF
jgi:hypothetical protein